jgi:hypothetical protein
MKKQLERAIYKHMLEFPTKTDYQIAEDLGIKRWSVWKFRQKVIGQIDYELGKKIAGKFLTEFQMAADYFKLQIERLAKRKQNLETLLNQKKTVLSKDEEGNTIIKHYEMDPLDKAQIIKVINDVEKQQTDLWKNIIFLANQGQGVEVMRMIRDGRIQLPSE